MWTLKGETRPKCKWREHDFQLVKYVVSDNSKKAFREKQCVKCGRIIFHRMGK